ncbi:MAG: hypothetical protein QM217_08085 [Bacillota bacterium]|nr:hypothetical protein [Bacillota bacterium]
MERSRQQATHAALPIEVFNQVISVIRALPDSQVHDLVEEIKLSITTVTIKNPEPEDDVPSQDIKDSK